MSSSTRIEIQGLECRAHIDNGNLVFTCSVPLDRIPGKVVANMSVPTIQDVIKIMEKQSWGKTIKIVPTKQYTRVLSSKSSRSVFVIQEQKDALLIGVTKELTGNTDVFIYIHEVSYQAKHKKNKELSSKYSFVYSPSYSRINLIQEVDCYTNGNFKQRNMKYIHEIYAYEQTFPLGQNEMPKHFPPDLREMEMKSINVSDLSAPKVGIIGHDSDGNPIFDFLDECNELEQEESNRILLSLPYSEDPLFWEIFEDFPDYLTYLMRFGGSPDDQTLLERETLEKYLDNLSPVNYEDLHEQISNKNLGVYCFQDTRFPHIANFKFSNKEILETFFDDLSEQLELLF
jgi:hypothetical protein